MGKAFIVMCSVVGEVEGVGWRGQVEEYQGGIGEGG